MTTVTNEDYWMHIVRNPFGYTDEQVRDARLHLADAFEAMCQRVNELEANQSAYAAGIWNQGKTK